MEVLIGKLGHFFKKSEVNVRRKHYGNIKFDENPNATWSLVGILGKGAFGCVHKAENKFSGRLAAAKVCELENEDELQDLSVEISILSICNHKNIVKLIDSYYYDSKLWIMIEFCEVGAVDSIMKELERPLTESQIKYVCHELCEGLAFLHRNKIIHRDMKAGNVLLTIEGEVKIADFGVSAKNKHTMQKRDTFIGTQWWMAPEIIQCETVRDNPYDYKADIWSLGITLIEFAQRDPPHNDLPPVRVLFKILKSEPPTLDFPSRWSKEFNEFLSLCLNKDPNQRPSAVDLLEHAFICDSIDSKPICDLISEFKADIVEEVEVELEGSEQDPPSPIQSSTSSPSATTSRKKYQTPIPQVDNNRMQSPYVESTTVNANDCIEANINGSLTPARSQNQLNKRTTQAEIVKNNNHNNTSSSSPSTRSSSSRSAKNNNNAFNNNNDSSSNNNLNQSKQNLHREPTRELKTRRKTLTRTRKFVIDGVVMTTTTSKIIYADEDVLDDDHELRKQELRELKMLQKQEARQFQYLLFKAQCAAEQLEKKLHLEMTQLLKDFETELEVTNRHQKQVIEKLEQQQEETLKETSREVRTMQQNELKAFREQLKIDFKCAKQEIDYLPKATRRAKKDKLALDQADAARSFIDRLNAAHDAALKHKTEIYQEQLAAYENKFLVSKQQILRAREAAIWELEERHMLERQQLEKHQLKEIFFLQRHQMFVRHEKEMEQMKRINARHEENLLKRQALERRQLPKRIRSEMKTRELMFRESMRINTLAQKSNGNDSQNCNSQEREKLRRFQESEKNRYKGEQRSQELKHQRQLEELRASAIQSIRELEQIQSEKRKALMEYENSKLKKMESDHGNDVSKWRRSLKARKTRLEEELHRSSEHRDMPHHHCL